MGEGDGRGRGQRLRDWWAEWGWWAVIITLCVTLTQVESGPNVVSRVVATLTAVLVVVPGVRRLADRRPDRRRRDVVAMTLVLTATTAVVIGLGFGLGGRGWTIGLAFGCALGLWRVRAASEHLARPASSPPDLLRRSDRLGIPAEPEGDPPEGLDTLIDAALAPGASTVEVPDPAALVALLHHPTIAKRFPFRRFVDVRPAVWRTAPVELLVPPLGLLLLDGAHGLPDERRAAIEATAAEREVVVLVGTGTTAPIETRPVSSAADQVLARLRCLPEGVGDDEVALVGPGREHELSTLLGELVDAGHAERVGDVVRPVDLDIAPDPTTEVIMSHRVVERFVAEEHGRYRFGGHHAGTIVAAGNRLAPSEVALLVATGQQDTFENGVGELMAALPGATEATGNGAGRFWGCIASERYDVDLDAAAVAGDLAIARIGPHDPRGMAQALWDRGHVDVRRDDHEAAIDRFERTAELARSVGDERMVGRVHQSVGTSLHRLGDLPGARERYAAAIETAQRLDRPRWLSRLTYVAGAYAFEAGDLDAAEDLERRSVNARRTVDPPEDATHPLLFLAAVAAVRSDEATALSLLDEATAEATAHGSLEDEQSCLDLFAAEVRLELGQPERAAEHARASLGTTGPDGGPPRFPDASLALLGIATSRLGDHDAGADMLTRALDAAAAGHSTERAEIERYLGECQLRRGHLEDAARHLGAARVRTASRGNRLDEARCLHLLGELDVARADTDAAARHFLDAEAVFRSIGLAGDADRSRSAHDALA